MSERTASVGDFARRLLAFARRVLHNFFLNNGFLLAGGLGYNMLLSAVPLLGLLGILLTRVVEEEQLLPVLAVLTRRFAPAHADLWLDAVRSFMASPDIIGIAGVPVALVFSSLAFRTLDVCIGIIFQRPESPRRSLWFSAALPFACMLLLGVGLLTLTFLFTFVQSLSEEPGTIFFLFSFFSVFLLFSAVYKVLPTLHISPRRALIGGLVAATLWEATRMVMVYYFVAISFVDVIYSSLATVIVLLIGLEVGAIILLLGAQVIAELERSERAGVPWHLDGG